MCKRVFDASGMWSYCRQGQPTFRLDPLTTGHWAGNKIAETGDARVWSAEWGGVVANSRRALGSFELVFGDSAAQRSRLVIPFLGRAPTWRMQNQRVHGFLV